MRKIFSLVHRLVKSKLQETKNKFIAAQKITANDFDELGSILIAFNQIWRQQEEEKRRRATAEDSLYVNK